MNITKKEAEILAKEIMEMMAGTNISCYQIAALIYSRNRKRWNHILHHWECFRLRRVAI